MDNSPFNRSSRIARTPPPTPLSSMPESTPRPKAPSQAVDVPQVITTSDIQSWMTSIEQWLNEVCSIATEGKLNSDQKMRISNLCRKVGHGTSQMAVQYQSLKQKAVQMYSTVQTLQDENELSERLKELKLSIDESSKPVTATSFADMVKNGTNNYVQPQNYSSVVIYPNDKLKSSEETKTLVQKMICPEQLKLHVRGLRKTRHGGVIISTETKNDIDKLKQKVQLANSGLKIDEHTKRRPRIVVIGVPTSLSEQEVFKCLYEQNLAEQQQEASLETFLNSVKLSHKSGKKDADTCNYVIEVSASIRRALISKERLYINWSSCPVKDFTLVTRCYKCQQYGHAAKTCREELHSCGHCGELGHSISLCPTKTEAARCATCLRYKKPSNHSTGAADCPAKLMAERRYIHSVDYGSA